MGVGQHACPQVGVLGLGPIIIREDMSQGALLECSHQGATLPCVTDQEIELPLVYDQPPGQPFFVSHAALGKFADNRAGLVSDRKSDFSLSPERDNRFPDFESLQQARLHKEDQERRRGPTGICKMPSKPGRDDRMTGSLKLPFLDLSEACTYVPGESH